MKRDFDKFEEILFLEERNRKRLAMAAMLVCIHDFEHHQMHQFRNALLRCTDRLLLHSFTCVCEYTYLQLDATLDSLLFISYDLTLIVHYYLL